MLGLAVRRCVCDKLYAKGRMPRDAPLSTVEALGYMCLLVKEVPLDNYKETQVENTSDILISTKVSVLFLLKPLTFSLRISRFAFRLI